MLRDGLRQYRRKRLAQFCTAARLRHRGALVEARDNGHWDELGSSN
jgi:hypothetical protein